MLWRLNKPEYFYRPSQIFRRILRMKRPAHASMRKLPLPWGASIEVDINETIGFAIWRLGIYDLVVSEVLWRLTEAGDSVADVGANLGYMTSLLAKKAGERGVVTSFEPHPELFQRLSKNASCWTGSQTGQIRLIQKAASDREGKSLLMIPRDFFGNTGTAFLEGVQNSNTVDQSFEIDLVPLDQVYPDRGPRVMKIDTEGSEIFVLKGAKRLLSERGIRDIVFECHEKYPNPVTSFLEERGYAIFRLEKTFSGPKLVPIQTQATEQKSERVWEAASFLATLDPKRALNLVHSTGWRILE